MTDSTLTSAATELYTQVLLDAAHYPQCQGHLAQPDLKTTARNASCGDIVSVEIQLDADKKRIQLVRWEGQGCIISQAHMDALATQLSNQLISEVKKWDKPEVLALFGLPEITPGREKCLLLGLRAVQQAIATV